MNRKTVLEILTGLSGLAAFLAGLLTLFDRLRDDAEALRIVSVVLFILFLGGMLWLLVRETRGAWRWVSVLIVSVAYVLNCLFFIWVGTWITPEPEPVTIDAMEDPASWFTYQSEQTEPPAVELVSGRTGNAMEISYTVPEDGWVGVCRNINPAILRDTTGIGFFYKGSGSPNTLELKLIYKPDDNGESAIFSASWNHVTDAKEWRLLEAPYSVFVCWPDTGCELGEILDPEKVARIDIAISNKAVDEPGSGVLVIDDIEGLR